MKICNHCEYPIDENASICPYCGKEQSVNEVVSNKEDTNDQTSMDNKEIESDDGSSVSNKDSLKEIAMNEKISCSDKENNQDDSKAVLSSEDEESELSDFDLLKPHVHQIKNYFSQLGQAIIHPPLTKTVSNQWLGIINFIVIAFFYALALSRLVGRLFYNVLNTFGHYGLYFKQDLRTFPFFFGFFICIILLQLVAVLIYWGFASAIMHEEISFHQAFDRIFAPLSLLVPISVFACLFTLVGGVLSTIALVFILLHFAFIRYSFHANLWLVDNPHKHNRFYITLIPTILYIIASILIMQILMHFAFMHAQIQDILQQIFARY